jgi:hypothetical protein
MCSVQSRVSLGSYQWMIAQYVVMLMYAQSDDDSVAVFAEGD